MPSESTRPPRLDDVEPHDSDAAEAATVGAGVCAGSIIRRFLAVWAESPGPPPAARFFGASGLDRLSARLYRAAVAEFTVAEIANRAAGGGAVVHGLSRSGFDSVEDPPRDDVSHVIVSERGVFALTTVNPAGSPAWVSANSFIQDGVRMAHLRDAEFNALRLSQRLFERSGRRVEVVPAVVVANPRRLIVERRPGRVALLRPREVAPWLESYPPILAPDEIDQLARTTTAIASARSSEPSSFDDLLARFRAVHHELERASRKRIGWIAVGLLAVWVALVAVAGYL